MSPDARDRFDPAHIVLRQAELEGNVNRVSDALVNATQNMGSALQSVQIDIRTIVGKMENLVTLGERQQRLDDEMERAFEAIEKLADTSKEKWNEHHAAESQAKAVSDKEIRNAREKLILWGGVGIGFSMLAATVTLLVAWQVNSRFANQAQDHDKLDTRVDKYIESSGVEREKTKDRVEKIEKYLIRGGKNPDEPYNDGGTK